MKELIFLGTNSVLERHIEACDRQNIKIRGIIDSDWFGNREKFAGIPIIDTEKNFENKLSLYQNNVFFIGVNWNPLYDRDFQKRHKFINLVRRYRLSCVNLIDPQSYVSSYAKLGQGIFIGAHVTVEPNVVINDFVTVWNNAVIGHNTIIGENTVLQRQCLVHAKDIGANTYIGISSSVVKNFDISIGNNVIIAPCLHVARNVPDNEKVSLTVNAARVYRKHGFTVDH